MNRFATLLRREWMQHRLGWTIVTGTPLVIALLLLLTGHITVTVDDSKVSLSFAQVPAVALAGAAIIGTGVLSFVLAWSTSLLQAGGLARRDQQDRSIEFWLSLPVGHASSVAAPLLAHLLLFPLAALALGLLAGQCVALLLVARYIGVAEWFTLPWGLLTLAWVCALLRISLGLLLATLWLAPIILLVMAASAWLKRWGLPALIAAVALLGNVLDKLHGNPVVWDLGRALLARAGRAFVTGRGAGGLRPGPGTDALEVLRAFPAWAAGDAGQALQALADPLLALALAVSAACFGLLVLRRQRG